MPSLEGMAYYVEYRSGQSIMQLFKMINVLVSEVHGIIIDMILHKNTSHKIECPSGYDHI